MPTGLAATGMETGNISQWQINSFMTGHNIYHVQQVLADDRPGDNLCSFDSSLFQLFPNIQGKQPSQSSSINKEQMLHFCLVKI